MQVMQPVAVVHITYSLHSLDFTSYSETLSLHIHPLPCDETVSGEAASFGSAISEENLQA